MFWILKQKRIITTKSVLWSNIFEAWTNKSFIMAESACLQCMSSGLLNLLLKEQSFQPFLLLQIDTFDRWLRCLTNVCYLIWKNSDISGVMKWNSVPLQDHSTAIENICGATCISGANYFKSWWALGASSKSVYLVVLIKIILGYKWICVRGC